MSKIFTSVLFFLLLLMKTPVTAQKSSLITIEKNDVVFSFSISCDGGPCEFGQFVNGDYWVIPNSPNGKVRISRISPDGELHGAMVNPDLLRDEFNELIPADEQRQGFISGYNHYNASLNLMNKLPYEASANQSILKIASMNQGCGTPAIETGCVKTSTVLTILAEVPPNRGANLFRPPFHGRWKPLFTTEKVRMNRLPRLPQASDGNGGQLGGAFGFEHWLAPEVELYRQGDFGEFFRAMIPHAAQPSYASDQMLLYLEDLTKVFGLETEEEKRLAVYSLIQKGIDNYGVFKMGIAFSSGAGQHMGKKPAIVFFAAMYDDNEILEEVRGMSTDEDLLNANFFQEDSQIRMGKSGMSIWGDFEGFDKVHGYFSQLYPQVDKKGTIGDPYGYIDGPAGAIHPDPNQTRDRNYLPVVGGLYVGYSLMQHVMPWYKYASNDFEVLQFSDRVYDGYGIENFDGGLWTKPDPCAPYDDRENPECSPFRLYSTGITKCDYYMDTWGPKEEDLSDFIPHNGDPNTDGRMPELHGRKIDFNRIPSIVREYWDELRPCADPNNPNYPCDGLGEIPHNSVPDVSIGDASAIEGENISFSVSLSSVSANDVKLTFVLSNGTASNEDYSVTDIQLTIPAGSVSGVVVVPTTADTIAELDETFTIAIRSVDEGVIGDMTDTAKGTIIDDDTTGPDVSIGDASAIEGENISFSVSLSGVSANDIKLTFVLSNGTASNEDYSVTDIQLTIPAGSVSELVVVPTTADTIAELDETFTIAIRSVDEGVVGDMTDMAKGTIVDDDTTGPDVSIGDASAIEGENIIFPVSLSSVSANDVKLTFMLSNGTASNEDYSATDIQVTIPAGRRFGLAIVPTAADTIAELDETFVIAVLSVDEGVVGDMTDTAKGTILDDDSTDIAFDDNMEIEILVDNNGFSLSAPLGYAHISVRIYSLTGVLLVDKVSSGKSFNMNWLENQITIPGIYIYKVSLDKKVYYGKFAIINN